MKKQTKSLPNSKKYYIFPSQRAIAMCFCDYPIDAKKKFPILPIIIETPEGKLFGTVICDGYRNNMEQICTTNWYFKNRREATAWKKKTIACFKSRGWMTVEEFAKDFSITKGGINE